VFPFLTVKSTAQLFLITLRRQKLLFMANMATVALGLVLPLIFLSLFGLFGMALERIVAGMLLTVFYISYVLKKEIQPPFRPLLYTFNRSDSALLALFLRSIRSHGVHLAKLSMVLLTRGARRASDLFLGVRL